MAGHASRYNSRQPYWTASEDTLFTMLWGKGEPVAVIAARLGKTVNAVAGRRNRLGLPKRQHAIASNHSGRASILSGYLADGMELGQCHTAMTLNKVQIAQLFDTICRELGPQAR